MTKTPQERIERTVEKLNFWCDNLTANATNLRERADEYPEGYAEERAKALDIRREDFKIIIDMLLTD